MTGRGKPPVIFQLSELADGQDADFFALLTAKEELKTRDGKPYYRVSFRDAGREVSFPIWSDSTWFEACRDTWQVGEFYKLRATYRQTSYGPQLDIRKIRGVADEDRLEGFDPLAFQPGSRYDPVAMFNELVAMAGQHIADSRLQALVLHLLNENREALLTLPAATRNHHAYVGGWLEHVLSVTRTCVYLAERYTNEYPDLQPPLCKDLVVAGGILHDIGKLRELRALPAGPDYTSEGWLIGHVLQGRDMLRETAAVCPIDSDVLLRLEHIIVSHQRLPEWGAPKPPMTPEALLVHFADDTDAKFHMMYSILREDTAGGVVTSSKNILQQRVFKGPPPQK
jgi:3'-5' exoribonuclease